MRGFHNPFFRELFQTIEEALFACSCLLHSVSTSDQSDLSPLATADGVIILGRCSDDFLIQIRKYTRNIIGIDRNPTDYKMDEIICNGKTAAIKAMEHLRSLGHQKIGYIGDCSSESRYVGYCETLIARSIPLNYNYICSTDQTYDSGCPEGGYGKNGSHSSARSHYAQTRRIRPRGVSL